LCLNNLTSITGYLLQKQQLLLRCMEYKHGLTMRKVYLSVRPSNVWCVTKQKKHVPTFLYHTKYHSP